MVKLVQKTPSPSHTVGSEREQQSLSDGAEKMVTIPHGGLRTNEHVAAFIHEHPSPSHTVGSEPKTVLCSSKIYSK